MKLRMREKQTLVGRVECFGFDKFDPYKNGRFSIDTETTGLDMWGQYLVDRELWPCRPYQFSLCDDEGNTASIRWQVNPWTRCVYRDEETFKLLESYLADERLEKIFHNFAFDNHMLRESGFTVAGRCHDTQIRMRVLVSNENNLKLKPLCKRYLQIPDDDEKDLQASTVKARRFAKKMGWPRADAVQADYYMADPDLSRRYAEVDAYRTMALFLAQEEALEEDEGSRAVCERERRLMHVLDRCEMRGVRVDMERNEEVAQYYEKILEESKQAIVEEAGVDFNPNSAPQKQRIFFGRRGLKPLAYSRKKKSRVFTDCVHCKGIGCKICQMTGRNPKCDGDFLEQIAVERDEDDNVRPKDKLAYSILMTSAASNMMNFVKSYRELVVRDEDGCYILHPNYNQAKPKTGRLSAERPNLQNVASDESGKKKVDIEYRPRECFIPRPGFMLYIPDYSQIEVWILALLSGDRQFIRQLAKGGDAHQIVADMAYEGAYDKKIAAEAELLPPDKLTAKQKKHLKIKKALRKRVKTLNFGIIYGQGDPLTAASLGCTVAEAKAFKREYFDIFPAVRKFMERSIREAKENGTVTSPWGRTYQIDRGLEYRACNYLIQGSAADLMKSAMINVDELQTTKYNGDMFLLLNIHDELMIEVRESVHSEETMRDVAAAMSADYKFLGAPVPFPVGMKIAYERWNVSQEIML